MTNWFPPDYHALPENIQPGRRCDRWIGVYAAYLINGEASWLTNKQVFMADWYVKLCRKYINLEGKFKNWKCFN